MTTIDQAAAALAAARQAHINAHNAWVATLPVLPEIVDTDTMYFVDSGHTSWKYARSCVLSKDDDGAPCWIVHVESRGWNEFGDMETPFNYYVRNEGTDGEAFYRLPDDCDINWD